MLAPETLAELLPIDRLEASARRRIEDLLSSEAGSAKLQDHLRLIVEDLLRSQDLIKVNLSSQTGSSQALYIVRGTSRLVDLFGYLPVRKDRSVMPVADPEPEERSPVRGDLTFDEAISLLDAMEYAQKIEVGDPRSHEAGLLVGRILSLLQRTIPQILLCAQLHGLEDVGQETGDLLLASDAGSEKLWLGLRRLGQVFWISDITELPELLSKRLASSLTPEAQTVVVPILSPLNNQAEVGILYISARPTYSRERLLDLGRRLASFVTNRWRQQHEVNRRVLTDSLTGIHNRAFYDIQLPLELERARRAGESLTLVLCDLDHFKNVNDKYGHPCGDLVLRTVACRLQNTLRRIDHVCRIGGEEFACLLPSTSSIEARDVLSRLVGLPSRISLPPAMGGASLTVTMSYGAVCYPEAGSSHSELHRKADTMLYQAKQLGRNRCCLWMPDGRHQMLLSKKPADPPA